MKKFLFSLLFVCGVMTTISLHAQKSTTYVILTTVSPSDPYYQAVQTLSTYRSAQVIHFSYDSITDLIPSVGESVTTLCCHSAKAYRFAY